MEAKIESKFVLELNNNEEIINFASAIKKISKKEGKIGFGKVLSPKELIIVKQINELMSGVTVVENTEEGLYS